MQYRYFIGLLLPAEVRERITLIQHDLFDEKLMRQPLEPHITLLPPPAVERIDPEELARQCKITAETFLPLEIELTTLTAYKDYAIVINVESSKIYELQQQLIQLLPPDVETIYYPNPHFSPHVTLAQARRGSVFDTELVQAYVHALDDVLPVTFEATTLTLFRWQAPRSYSLHQL